MRRSAFTLIELLVVIAIIGILAAIIFPVFARAKREAYKSSDMTDMNEIRTALQMYRADQGGFPPILLGYVTVYTSGPLIGQVVPAHAANGPLLPRRIDSFETLKPALNKFTHEAATTAVWPNQDSRAVGSAPILDLNGDGNITGADDPANARQELGPGDGPVQRPDPANPGQFINADFYQVSGYDVESAPDPINGGRRFELRYTLFWTTWGRSTGNQLDDPRQLGYVDPPENTVVTWNSMFRDYPTGSAIPAAGRHDLVLFLGGSARTFDTRAILDRSWRVLP